MTGAQESFEDSLGTGFSGEGCHADYNNANNNRVWTAHDL